MKRSGSGGSSPAGFFLEDEEGDEEEDQLEELDEQTQARLDEEVDRLLRGYDWTLAPLANK